MCRTIELRFGAATIFDLTQKEVLDGFSCTECGRCQDACPAYATGKILSPKLLIMGMRDQVLAQSAEPIVGNGVPEQIDLGLRHVRRVRRGVPGLDRAHRPHRRSPEKPGDGRLEVPGGGGADAARRRARHRIRGASRRPSGQRGRSSSACACSSQAIRAPEYLYWVGCAASFDERAKKRPSRRRSCSEGGRRRLRDPRPARVVHGRSRAADGQRVRVPGLRRAERRAR